MIKKILIILFVSLVIVFAIYLALILTQQKREKPVINTTPFPTIINVNPTPFSAPVKNPNLSILSITPNDTSINIPLNQQIIIQLSKTFTDKNITVSFSPEITFEAVIKGNLYTIKPNQPLMANTTYTLFIRLNDQTAENTSFTTIADPSQEQQDNISQLEEAITKNDYPDSYLSAFTPFGAADFAISSDFTYTPSEHFFFKVTLLGLDKSKAQNDLFSWIKSLGLTDGQIRTLDIRYQ